MLSHLWDHHSNWTINTDLLTNIQHSFLHMKLTMTFLKNKTKITRLVTHELFFCHYTPFSSFCRSVGTAISSCLCRDTTVEFEDCNPQEELFRSLDKEYFKLSWSTDAVSVLQEEKGFRYSTYQEIIFGAYCYIISLEPLISH